MPLLRGEFKARRRRIRKVKIFIAGMYFNRIFDYRFFIANFALNRLCKIIKKL